MKRKSFFDWVLARMDLTGENEEEETEEFQEKKEDLYRTVQHPCVCLTKPASLQEGNDIVSFLKTGDFVVMDLAGVLEQTAQRILDYVAGAAYALGAKVEKVNTGIFLIVPVGMDVVKS